jgi:hypothetical protein
MKTFGEIKNLALSVQCSNCHSIYTDMLSELAHEHTVKDFIWEYSDDTLLTDEVMCDIYSDLDYYLIDILIEKLGFSPEEFSHCSIVF